MLCGSVHVQGWGFKVCLFFSAGVSSVCGTWCRWCRCSWGWCWSVVVVAVRAQNLAAVGEEAGAHQWHGAARTLETRLVPLPVLKRNVLPISKTCEATREHIMRAIVPAAATPLKNDTKIRYHQKLAVTITNPASPASLRSKASKSWTYLTLARQFFANTTKR